MNKILKALAILLVMQYGHVFTTSAQVKVDTLGWNSYHQGADTLYLSPNGGYVFGNNGYGDKVKARIFESPLRETAGPLGGPVEVNVFGRATKAIFKFGSKVHGSGDPDSRIAVRFYGMGGLGQTAFGVDSTAAPSAELLENGTDHLTTFLYMDDIDTNGYTVIDNLPTADAEVFYTQFAIGLDVSLLSAGDTVGLYSTIDGDAGGVETAWDLVSANDWISVLHPIIGWGLDVEPAIFVEFEYDTTTVSVPELDEGGMSLYPNPSSEYLTVKVDAMAAGVNSVSIWSLEGRKVYEVDGQFHNSWQIDVAGIPDGLYILKAEGRDKQLTTKLQILH